MVKELDSVYGNKFKFRVEEKENISVLSGGYAITPNGEFVNVLDNEDHSDIFTNYLRAYLEAPTRAAEDSIHALITLTKLNHVAYSGIKLGDNIKNSTIEQGYALLVLPNDISVLTIQQKESLLAFFKTNKSIFGNYNKVELQIHDFDGGEFTQEELTERFINELEELKGKQI